MFFYKLKAGALQLTVFIVVVIALLLATFIIFVHTQKQFSIQTNFIIETTKNASDGIDYALNNSVKINDTITVDLKDEDYKSLKLHREFWGLFEKVISTSKIKTNQFQKIALIGARQPKNNRTALYIQDNNKPLVVVGNTKIEGVAYLPKQGVKSGTISGNSYYGSQLIYGQTRVSSNLPQLFTETENHLKNLEKNILNTTQENFINNEPGNSYINSFLKPLQVVFNASEIKLINITLIGHIVIQSKTKIVVDASTNLKDIILIAPKIEIQSGVKGNFQAIASQEIVVNANCKLAFPTALVLVEDESILSENNSIITENNATPAQNINHITINSNATVKGAIVFLGSEKQNNYNVQVAIETDATVFGEVYCSANLELKGSVFGSVFTNNFIAKQFGSVYQNHIYNGTISVEKLPQEYVGLVFPESKKNVLKWLY